MKYTTGRCSIKKLLLDPNNYRFLDETSYQEVSEKRYHEPGVQDKAYRLLKGNQNEDLRPLKESILTNGYVPLEQIIVRPYGKGDEYFVVIEGNRRVVTLPRI